jgi:YVTN family beta-propeller protein
MYRPPQELLVPVAAVGLGDDGAASDIKGGEQAGRAVADVTMGHPRRGRGRHRQAGGGPVAHLAYVTNFHTDSVSVINTDTNTVTATIDAGRNPTSVAVDPATHTACITNGSGGSVSVISTG